jgi:tRNA pseudouridine38-40 synthase
MNTFDFDDRYQFLVEFAYNGAHFYGVQEQPNLKTVLGTLRERIESASDQRASCLFVAARTDRGVHALHNCATFYLKPPLDASVLMKLVAMPRADGLSAVSIKRVEKKVHARAGSGKIYRYTIIDDTWLLDEVTNQFAWVIAPKLCVERMQQAAKYLVGEMDFSSLRGGGCQAGSTIKHVYYVNVARIDNGAIIIEISGNSFLRKMIRNMVGLLVEVGAGFRSSDCIPSVLAEKSRQAAGIMTPAHGLMLVKVLLNH